MNTKKFCLVLAGGGAKGVYHIGALRALRELKVPICAVVGNSVGALVSGFVAQKNYKALEALLDDLSIDTFVSVPQELVRDGEFALDPKNLSVFLKFRKDIYKTRGLDTLPMRTLLYNNLSEKKIRKSGIDLGIVTYRLDEFSPREIFLDQMEEGSVLDYLLASATLPGFKLTEINDKKYIDGGVYNNIPFNMAKSRGYKNIIVVDISGLGRKKRPNYDGTMVVHIKNSIDMGGVLDFNQDFLKKFTELGYLDTLKAFDVCKGWSYCFRPDDLLEEKLGAVLFSELYMEEALRYCRSDLSCASDFFMTIRELLPEEMVHYPSVIYPMADCAAALVGLERIQLYDFESLIGEIFQKARLIEEEVEEIRAAKDKTSLNTLLSDVKGLLKKMPDKPLYFYELAIEHLLGGMRNALPFASLDIIKPGTRSGRLFIKLLHLYRNGTL